MNHPHIQVNYYQQPNAHLQQIPAQAPTTATEPSQQTAYATQTQDHRPSPNKNANINIHQQNQVPMKDKQLVIICKRSKRILWEIDLAHIPVELPLQRKDVCDYCPEYKAIIQQMSQDKQNQRVQNQKLIEHFIQLEEAMIELQMQVSYLQEQNQQLKQIIEGQRKQLKQREVARIGVINSRIISEIRSNAFESQHIENSSSFDRKQNQLQQQYGGHAIYSRSAVQVASGNQALARLEANEPQLSSPNNSHIILRKFIG